MFNHNLKVSCQFNKWNSELAIICYVNKLLFPLLKTLFKYMFKAYFYTIVCSEHKLTVSCVCHLQFCFKPGGLLT